MAYSPSIAIGVPFFRAFDLIDPQAQAFLTAAGITDPTIVNAINRLVKNYKGQGNLNNSVDLWTGLNAIYPFVGGSASSHKFNLKNPLDTDAAFRLSFSGGWTHSANGIIGNGTNTFANTFLNPNTSLIISSGRIGVYIRNNVAENRYDMGSGSGLNELSVYSRSGGGSLIASYGLNTQNVSTPNSDSRGLYVTNRNSLTTTQCFKNGNLGVSGLQTLGISTQPIYIGALNNAGTPALFSSKNLSFSIIGSGLSDANSLIEYQIIQQFQTDLSRNVA